MFNRLANEHSHRYAGLTCVNNSVIYALEYGALRSVYAAKACNYSYREFWF